MLGETFCHRSVLAILNVSEPIYMQTLRPIVSPTISIADDEMSVAHIEEVMTIDYSKLDLNGYDEM